MIKTHLKDTQPAITNAHAAADTQAGADTERETAPSARLASHGPGKSPSLRTANADLVRQLLDTAANSGTVNRLYCDASYCAYCETYAPKAGADGVVSTLRHKDGCLVARAFSAIEAPLSAGPADKLHRLVSDFRDFSGRVLEVIPHEHVPHEKALADNLLDELSLLGEQAATSPIPEAPEANHVELIVTGMQQFIDRACRYASPEQKTWVADTASSLLRQLSVIPVALGFPTRVANPDLDGDSEDPQDQWLFEFQEKLADYVAACIDQNAPDARPENALRPRAFYKALWKHVRAAAPAGLDDVKHAQTLFQKWWTTPSSQTGHPPGAILDEYSASTAWLATLAGRTAGETHAFAQAIVDVQDSASTRACLFCEGTAAGDDTPAHMGDCVYIRARRYTGLPDSD